MQSHFDQVKSEIKDGWKLEAKSEDSERYFYFTDEVHRIANGKSSYVIGRKGTGKTAISEYILSQKTYNKFAVKLTFKSFPFNELCIYKNEKYTGNNQYITFWKYVIYSYVCIFFVDNNNIDSTIREHLGKVFNYSPELPLGRVIDRWRSDEFEVNLFSIIKYTMKNLSIDNMSLSDKVSFFEDIILENIDDSSYYIIFDELDEDYVNAVDCVAGNDYSKLLIGIIKAVQDIKSLFSKRAKLYPVVFLRDDIYSLLLDNDKSKWDDSKLNIEWDEPKLKKLLSFRLERTLDAQSSGNRAFLDMWNKFFSQQQISVGNMNRKRISIFDFISRDTLYRPRDFTRYIKDCFDMTTTIPIHPGIVTKAENSFSNYLRSEFVDEIHTVLPDISSIFDMLSQLRKQYFSIVDFKKAFNGKVKEGSIKHQLDPDLTLRILFNFSVIGNQRKDKANSTDEKHKEVFKYKRVSSNFNASENLVIHRGLYNTLEIF